MFANEQIIYEPAFYFLVAITIVLTLSFRWGRKVNQRIIHSSFDPLLAVLKARDQEFTNIGGQTGYHVKIVPGAMRLVREVTGTLTLLPRQSLLYLPFALLFGRRDRLVLSFHYNKRGRALAGEAHLITPRQMKRPGSHITSEELDSDTISWGERTYLRYWSSDDARARLDRLMELLPEPGPLDHVALVPSQDRAWLVITPKAGAVESILSRIVEWIESSSETSG